MDGTSLTNSDYQEYLIRLYFGFGDDYLLMCIDRAYLDFNRTLHGLSALQSKELLRNRGSDELRRTFIQLCRKQMPISSQSEFDDWHQAFCLRLKEIYRHGGYPKFRVGQAQKWINMTFRYIFAMGEGRLSGFARYYRFCHIPIDKVVAEAFWDILPGGFGCSWSRLDDYGRYLQFQKSLRSKFADRIPLDVEFKTWMKRMSEKHRKREP